MNVCTVVGLDGASDDSEISRSVQRDLWMALKSRRDALEAEIKTKLVKLKELCLKEAVSRFILILDLFHLGNMFISFLLTRSLMTFIHGSFIRIVCTFLS